MGGSVGPDGAPQAHPHQQSELPLLRGQSVLLPANSSPFKGEERLFCTNFNDFVLVCFIKLVR